MPLHHLFGSDETSALAAPIQSRIPQPYVALAEAEASRAGVAEGELLSLRVADRPLRLPVRIDASLALGLVGLPVGLEGIPVLNSTCLATELEGAR